MSQFIDYNTKKFADVWSDKDAFEADYAIWVPLLAGSGYSPLTAGRESQLYYLLYARYGNSPIAYMDENQFKAELFSIVFQYGGAWEKRLDIQIKLQGLSLEQGEGAELFDGTIAIYNHALNPASEPDTNTLDELNYIDSQNTQRFKYSKMDAYRRLWDILRSDVSDEFLRKFAKLFSKFGGNRRPIIYITEEEE